MITGERLQVFEHVYSVQHAAFSPDGQTVVTASNTAALWSVTTGERLQVFKHDGGVRHAAFSPDGRTVVTASWDKTAALWPVYDFQGPIHEAVNRLTKNQTCLTPEQRKQFFLPALTAAQWRERGCPHYAETSDK